jgi:hypothetical protein
MILARELRRSLIRQLKDGTAHQEDLKKRAGLNPRTGDCRVIRVFRGDDPPVVVKLWRRPGISGALRRAARATPLQNELAAMTRLRRFGVNVPSPLGSLRIDESGFPYTDALFLEDLGDCTVAVEYVKRLIREERKADLRDLLEGIVDMTVRMVDARVFDRDHSLINIIVNPAGRPVRVDLEIAKTWRVLPIPPRIYGEMLGRLIATFAFAVQPDVDQVTAFAQDLAEGLEAPPRVLRQAKKQVDRMMDAQRRAQGRNTRVLLPWGVVE